jgi:hypothetical protein
MTASSGRVMPRRNLEEPHRVSGAALYCVAVMPPST